MANALAYLDESTAAGWERTLYALSVMGPPVNRL